MLALVTAAWYVGGGLFALYLIICAVLVAVSEKNVCTVSQRLFDTFFELFQCQNELCVDKTNVNSLILALDAVNKSDTFDFYRQKDIFEKAAREYNKAVQRYNELVTGYPSCMVARMMGKEVAKVLKFE